MSDDQRAESREAVYDCKNELAVEIGVVPVKDSAGYEVAKVDCPRLPFYGEEVERQMVGIIRKDPEELGKEVSARLVAFAKAIGLKITPKTTVNKDPALTPLRGEDYDSAKVFNLFVDMGSTNSKWMVWEGVAKEDGEAKEKVKYEFDVKDLKDASKAIIKYAETSKVCAEYGIRYDKALAYSYDNEDFNDWLSSAALIFFRQIRDERKANAFNVYWSFPRFDAGVEGSHDIDFDAISKAVTNKLKEYGLKGSFYLVPEATALESMFRNRALHIVIASEKEVQSNQDEEAQVRQHNNDELAKVNATQDRIKGAHEKYVKEKRKWDAEHSGFWGTIAGWFSSEPEEESIAPYVGNFLQLVKDRQHELGDFRNVGLNSKSPFAMLFLDAGGSTLDYCYIPEGDGQVVSGSYLAGGKQVTENLMQLLEIDDFDTAEERKTGSLSSETYVNPKLYEATVRVYDDCLRDLGKKIIVKDRYLCVVCTGLGMRNLALRNLIREYLPLSKDQRMLWSEDIAVMVKGADSLKKMFEDMCWFNLIVRKLEEDRQPSPACDVIGGLFFDFVDRYKE